MIKLELDLRYLIVEASHCNLDDHSGHINKSEAQLDQVIALAQQAPIPLSRLLHYPS